MESILFLLYPAVLFYVCVHWLLAARSPEHNHDDSRVIAFNLFLGLFLVADAVIFHLRIPGCIPEARMLVSTMVLLVYPCEWSRSHKHALTLLFAVSMVALSLSWFTVPGLPAALYMGIPFVLYLLVLLSGFRCLKNVGSRGGAVTCNPVWSVFIHELVLVLMMCYVIMELLRSDHVLTRVVTDMLSLTTAVVCMTVTVTRMKRVRPAGPLEEKARSTSASPLHPSEEERMKTLFLRIENYMREAQPFLETDFNEDDLATEMYTNKAYLSRTVNRMSGSNFCQYVNSYRVKYAIELFKGDSRLKVADVSLMSGFHSVVSFNMAFKLHMNCTPSEYQRNLQAEKLMQ